METESKNIPKYESYKAAIELLNYAKEVKSLPHCIAAVALTESIIADRTHSYLWHNHKEFIEGKTNKNLFISTNTMLDKCAKDFPNLKIKIKKQKTGEEIFCTDLFGECKEWLKRRNKLLHGFAKSNPGSGTLGIDEFTSEAISATEKGIVLVSLIKKWHQQQIARSNKKQIMSWLQII